MFTADQLYIFIISSMLVAVTPGPDILTVLARAISQGRKPACVAAIGFALGCINHTLIVVLGMAALLKASPIAFNIIKYIGAAYLVYIGAQMIRQRNAPLEAKGNYKNANESGNLEESSTQLNKEYQGQTQNTLYSKSHPLSQALPQSQVKSHFTGKMQSLPGSEAAPVPKINFRKIFFQSILGNLLNPKVALFFLAFLPQFVRPQNGSEGLQLLVLGLLFMLVSFIIFLLVAIFAGGLGNKLQRHPKIFARLQGITGLFLIALGLRLALQKL